MMISIMHGKSYTVDGCRPRKMTKLLERELFSQRLDYSSASNAGYCMRISVGNFRGILNDLGIKRSVSIRISPARSDNYCTATVTSQTELNCADVDFDCTAPLAIDSVLRGFATRLHLYGYTHINAIIESDDGEWPTKRSYQILGLLNS